MCDFLCEFEIVVDVMFGIFVDCGVFGGFWFGVFFEEGVECFGFDCLYLL